MKRIMPINIDFEKNKKSNHQPTATVQHCTDGSKEQSKTGMRQNSYENVLKAIIKLYDTCFICAIYQLSLHFIFLE